MGGSAAFEVVANVFERGAFKGALGQNIYQVEMTDWRSRAYQMRACDVRFKDLR